MRIRQSDTISDLIGALVKFHCHSRVAAKNRANTHLGNDYADLSAVIDASDVPLAECGLVLTQTPYTGDDATTYVETMLAHVSGQFKAADMRVPVAPQKGLSEAQQLGSAMTYVMRYSRKAILGIADGYEDDDGANAGAPQGPAPQEHRVPSAAAQAFRTDSKPASALIDDVPFQVGPNDAAAMARSPAPVREAHTDIEIVKGAIATIGLSASVGAIRVQLTECDALPLTPGGKAALERAAALRMISVASSVKELAEVREYLVVLHKAGNGTEEWHAGAGAAHKARRAELTAKAGANA